MEELAQLREQLLRMVDEGGVDALADFVRGIKGRRNETPATVWEANKAVYGVPDAGQAFWMLMQDVHINKCGLMQTEVDPSIYIDVEEDDEGKVKEFILLITFTDDVRYFGTSAREARYEADVQEHLKCKMEGESAEFVSMEFHHDKEAGTLELKQPKYWEKAVLRFAEHMPGGPKARVTPVSVGDAALMKEATDEEAEEAKGLPYQELLGVLNYPFCHTKLEGRFVQSLLARHAHKWSKFHFRVAVKALEYV